MKKRAVSMILAAAMVCGMMAVNVSCVSAKGSDEGKVINIYSWNDEFRQRLEAVYPEVESTSKDGTVTKLKDGTEIPWIVIRTRMAYISRNWMRHFSTRLMQVQMIR